MAGPVVFDYAKFIGAYPEFVAVNEPQLENYFDIADSYFQNNTSNLAFRNGVPHMTKLMYMVTAHLTQLLAARDATGRPSSSGTQPAPGIVGRINSASEGSVSVGAELKGSESPSEAFFTQTTYGFLFWQATAQYRTFRYVPQVTPGVTPIYPFRGLWR